MAPYFDTGGRFAPSLLDYACLLGLVYLATKLYEDIRKRVKTTALRGPPSKSLIFGNHHDLVSHKDSAEQLEEWAAQYGRVFQISAAFSSKKIYLTDPKAIAHFYALETSLYVQPNFVKLAIAKLVGPGLLWAEGESHRRQRKTLTPAFSNQAIRTITPVFYDSAYKVKNVWDTLLGASSSGASEIDVQTWMNRVSLDSIGVAGFAHDFGALDGKHPDVAEVFARFSEPNKQPRQWVILFASFFPLLLKVPSPRNALIAKLHHSMAAVADELLRRTRAEEVGSGAKSEKSYSIIGSLVKAEASETELRLSPEEALNQMKLLILAGYETTSISLTWALIELAQDKGRQQKLREELAPFGNTDPSWDQLMTPNSLPYLDAVVRECLRLHPPVLETSRIAKQDDVIPLQNPITTASGQTIDRINIARGTVVAVPIRTMNRSVDIWGPDAKNFNPERWLYPDEDGVEADGSRGLPRKVMDIQGWRHLLTFIDGPRTCLGRGFAIAEFKAVLSVLVRNFKFELRDGKETKIELIRSILPRPKVMGEEGFSVPLKVTRVDV